MADKSNKRIAVINRSRNHKIDYPEDTFKRNEKALEKSGYVKMEGDEAKEYFAAKYKKVPKEAPKTEPPATS